MARDYYEVLGIGKTSTEAEVKKAYRKKAMDLHPDKHKGDKEVETRFKEINEAYEVLGDKAKRDQYDRFGEAGVKGGGSGFDANGFDFGGFQADFSGGGQGFSDIFDAFFTGFGGRPKGPRKGRNLEYELKVSFEDAAFGAEKELLLTRMEEGKKTEKIKVKIPAGVDNGSVIRLTEKGEPGTQGGPAGDLYIHIRVIPHDTFVRHGYDIHTEVRIHLVQAVIGDEIDIQTLKEKVKLKIPSGIQPGKVFKLKGYGVQKINSMEKGDHYVKLIVEIPTKLNKKEKNLYAELAIEANLELKAKHGFW